MSEINIPKFTKQIMTKHKFASMADNGELWWYNEKKGIWQPNGKGKIGYEIEKECESVSSFETREVEHKVIRRCPIHRTSFNNHSGYINILNGMIDLSTGNILPHSPDFYSISQVPIKYDPDAKCTSIEKFISEIVLPHEQQLLYELFGFLLFPSYYIHKAFIFFGSSGHNGKTTLIRLIQSFIGIENCSSVELQDFGKDVFAAASLYGKLANIADDLSSKAMESAGKFKQLTGESPISAQNKYERRFEFINHAKMIFACNRIPAAPKDADEPFYRRWSIMHFNNQFTGSNENKNIKYEITSQKELSGLLNIAIEKNKELRNKNQFSYELDHNETRRQFLAGSNDSIGMFLVDCVSLIPDSTEIKQDIYKYYCNYCDSKLMPYKDDNAFFRKFKEYCPNVNEIFIQQNGSRHRALRGIEING